MAKLPILSPANANCLDPRGLQPGDIILTTDRDSILAKGIRKGSGSPFSHAMIYIGDGKVVEAANFGTGDVRDLVRPSKEALDVRVGVRPLKEALEGSDYTVTYRHPDLTLGKAQSMIMTALSMVGTKYDIGAIISPSPDLCKINDLNSEYFCSELVAYLFKTEGIFLTEKSPGCTTPGDIAETVPYVGHLITEKGQNIDLETNTEEVSFNSEQKDTSPKQKSLSIALMADTTSQLAPGTTPQESISAKDGKELPIDSSTNDHNPDVIWTDTVEIDASQPGIAIDTDCDGFPDQTRPADVYTELNDNGLTTGPDDSWSIDADTQADRYESYFSDPAQDAYDAVDGLDLFTEVNDQHDDIDANENIDLEIDGPSGHPAD